MSRLLELTSVRKRFGGFSAVDGMDCVVDEGELRFLIGPNGAGKSTLFKLIVGAYQPDAGRVAFRGRDITSLPTWQRARIGISVKPQICAIYPDLTVRENLRIALQQRVQPRRVERETEALLRQLDLEPVATTKAAVLSHGQQQWLEIGMAMSIAPKLLLLDEPTAGMSTEETAKTGDLLCAINRESGVAILIVEHDMAFVRQIAQRVTVMHYGKVLAEGSVAEIETHEDVLRVYLGKGDVR